MFAIPMPDKVRYSERSGNWVVTYTPLHPRWGGSWSLAIAPQSTREQSS